MTRKDTVWQDKDLVASFLSGVRGAIPLAAEQIDIILRMIAGFRGDAVENFLDLGCGDGVLARAVLSKYLGEFLLPFRSLNAIKVFRRCKR